MENEVVQNTVNIYAYLGAAFCAFPMATVAWGLSKLWTTLIETVGRNPQTKKDLTLFGFIGMGSIEAIALYMLIIAILLLTM
jgi:F0F1-type ATP synthase membrane subunit c/vacuolar-type H+-ATPase subunit K